MEGKEIKLRLVALKTTQKDLAERLGITAQSVSAILSAKDVRSGTIEKIAHALNIPVSYFYGEESTGGVISHHNQVNGEGAYGNINGDGGADTTLLQERVKALQTLLEEKERTIKILMEKRVN